MNGVMNKEACITVVYLRTVKSQIRLRICAVRPESSSVVTNHEFGADRTDALNGQSCNCSHMPSGHSPGAVTFCK